MDAVKGAPITVAVTVSDCYHTGRIGTNVEQTAAVGGRCQKQRYGPNARGEDNGSHRLAMRQVAWGTNSLAIGAPSGGRYPILLDIATSVAPEGKVRDCLNRGKQLPEGWILDTQGLLTTNPTDLYKPAPGGCLQPLGGPVGYKGFGLAVMIDILAGGLSGAARCRAEEVPTSDDVTMLAINVENFAQADRYYAQVKALVEHPKSCPTGPGFEEVFVPGEHEFRYRKQRLAEGIDVDDVT